MTLKPIHIIGHGLAGCALAMGCHRRGIPFRLSGVALPGEASMASSGLIAPVTGRRYVKTWRIDEYIAFALDFYRWTESLFGNRFFHPVEIVRFLSNDEARQAWSRRMEEPEYAAYISGKRYASLERWDRPYGILSGGYRLDTPGWLRAAREFLGDQGLFQNIHVAPEALTDVDHTCIWATGSVDPRGSHGVIPNKGEAILARMPDWQLPLIVKDEVFLIPVGTDLIWIGSYYQPWPDHPGPTETGKNELVQAVKKIYNGRFEIVEHMAGVRPTVHDRRPLIGPHPGLPGHYLCNGMGTKGTSLAPFWADQLLRHLQDGVPLPKDVSPSRY